MRYTGTRMKKVRIADVPAEPFASPKEKFACVSQNISIALGRVKHSDSQRESHPFDLELCRIPKGTSMCPYHLHTAQTEFYHVVSGRGTVRDESGLTPVETGDAFLFKPGEAHQLFGGDDEDLVVYIIADNPVGDACFYPDSRKFNFPFGDKFQCFVAQDATYFDGEE